MPDSAHLTGVVLRLNPDGTYDNSFGQSGKAFVALGQEDNAQEVWQVRQNRTPARHLGRAGRVVERRAEPDRDEHVLHELLGPRAVVQPPASVIRANARETDIVARFGGDEFAILLTHIPRSQDAANVARAIKEALDQAYLFDDQEVFVRSSIWIAVYPQDGRDTASLLKNAGTLQSWLGSYGRCGRQGCGRDGRQAARRSMAASPPGPRQPPGPLRW